MTFSFSSSDAQDLVRFQDKRDTALFEGSTDKSEDVGAQPRESLLHVLAQWQFPEVWILRVLRKSGESCLSFLGVHTQVGGQDPLLKYRNEIIMRF